MSNWWQTNPSTQEVCGDFTDPVNPDLGKCEPYREKRDCEKPALPVIECADDTYTTEYDPDGPPFFRVIGKLFDSNCLPILDSTGANILTVIV